jgi:hypothetical protein
MFWVSRAKMSRELARLYKDKLITYITGTGMPEALRGRYQYDAQASMDRITRASYTGFIIFILNGESNNHYIVGQR